MCEFNWEAIKNVSATPVTKRGFGHQRELRNGKIVRIAANGFPVNFYNSESAPASKIQPILGMLFLGACRLIEDPQRYGVREFTVADQELISFTHRGGPESLYISQRFPRHSPGEKMGFVLNALREN
jgi:hypothetical protein